MIVPRAETSEMTNRGGGVASVPFSVGSLHDRGSLREAARLIKAGFPVGMFVRGVCVLMIDGENREAVEAIYHIKGEPRVGRPFGTVLDAGAFVGMLDQGRIWPAVADIFLIPETLASRLGDLCLVRAPITAAAADHLPEAMISSTPDGTRWLQNWVPFEHEAVCNLVSELSKDGVRYPAVTSMNITGQPELVDQTEAIVFCRTHTIPLFLKDPRDNSAVQGSFPLIRVDHAGVTLLREGHFPAFLFRPLLGGVPVDRTQAKPAAYAIVPTHGRDEASHLPAAHLRREIIARLEQERPEQRDGRLTKRR